MTTVDIREWIEQSFKPLKLATPPDVILQCIDQSILYWNIHSAFKVARMYDNSHANYFSVGTDVKSVVQVYPSAMRENILSDHPMWMLLGFVTLDNYTSDLMLLSSVFDSYKVWLGADFRWKWMMSEDSSVGGKVYIQSVPTDAAKFAVVGLLRLIPEVASEGAEPEYDIKHESVYDWVREYARALVCMREGNILRKADLIDAKNDGQVLMDEGVIRAEKLQEQLRQDGRWMLLARRK